MKGIFGHSPEVKQADSLKQILHTATCLFYTCSKMCFKELAASQHRLTQTKL